jgi:hypothetical protein
MVLIIVLKSKKLKFSLVKKIRLLRTSWNNQKHYLKTYYKTTLILIIQLKNKIIRIVFIPVVALIILFSNGNKISPGSDNPEELLYTLRNSSGNIERPVRSYNFSDNDFNDNLNKVVQCGIKGTGIVTHTTSPKQKIQTFQGLLDEEAKETEREIKRNEKENKQSEKLQNVSQNKQETKKLEDENKQVSKITRIKKIMLSYDNLISRCQYKLEKRAKTSKNSVKRFCYNSGSKIIRKLKFSHYGKFRLYQSINKVTRTTTRPQKNQVQTFQGLLNQEKKEQLQKSSQTEYILNTFENELLKSLAMKTKEELAQAKTALEKKCPIEEMNLTKLKTKMILSAIDDWKSNHEIEGETITEYFERQIKIQIENNSESRWKDFNFEREMKKIEKDFQIDRLDDISNDGSGLPKKIEKMQLDFEIFGIVSDNNKLIGFGITEKN